MHVGKHQTIFFVLIYIFLLYWIHYHIHFLLHNQYLNQKQPTHSEFHEKSIFRMFHQILRM